MVAPKQDPNDYTMGDEEDWGRLIGNQLREEQASLDWQSIRVDKLIDNKIRQIKGNYWAQQQLSPTPSQEKQ